MGLLAPILMLYVTALLHYHIVIGSNINALKPKGQDELTSKTKLHVLYSFLNRRCKNMVWPKCKSNQGLPQHLSLAVITLMLCGDISINPGPTTVKYPCQICGKAVKWKQMVIACDNCTNWYHTDCIKMNSKIYEALANTSLQWICCQCGLPNFSSSLFEEMIPTSLNSFSLLSY